MSRWNAAALLFYKLSVDGTQQATIVSAPSSGGRVILIRKTGMDPIHTYFRNKFVSTIGYSLAKRKYLISIQKDHI